MLTSETEVLICGAGPSGLMMACQLARYQIKFRIIDALIRNPTYSGALILHPASLEIFHKTGIDQMIVSQSQKIDTLRFVFNKKSEIRLHIAEAGEDISAFSGSYILEQVRTERTMTSFLNSLYYEVEHPVILRNFICNHDFIECFVTKEKSQKEKIIARYLVAADGSQSFIRQVLKIPFKGITHKKPLFISDFKNSLKDHTLHELVFSFSKDASIGVFPLCKDRLRIDGAFRNKKTTDNASQLVEKLKKMAWLDIEHGEVGWFSEFRAHKRIASSFSKDRCFLIGDAAHVFTPVGAQGMNTGFYDAFHLAWKLAYVIKGYAKPELLEKYGYERQKPVKRTAQITDFLFLLLSSDNLFFKFFRLIVLPVIVYFLRLLWNAVAVRKYIFRAYSGTGNNHRRLPDIAYRKNGNDTRLYDDLSSHGFTLLVFVKKRNKALFMNPQLDNYRHIISVVEIHYSQDTSVLFKKLHMGNSGYLLIKPDFGIACGGRSSIALRKYLNKTLIDFTKANDLPEL